MIIGPTLNDSLKPLKDWNYKIIASFYQTFELERVGINVTEAMDISCSDRVRQAEVLGYDPIFLCGPDWMANQYDQEMAKVAWMAKSTIMDLSGEETTLLPMARLGKIVEWYKIGILPLDYQDDISQQERAGMWMVARGFAMIDDNIVQFHDDWGHLEKIIRHLGVRYVDQEMRKWRRYYAESDDT